MPQANPALMLIDGDDSFVIHRDGTLIPESFNAEENTIDVVFSEGARGLRYDWSTDQVYEEELEISDTAVDFARINRGTCQVLDSHRTYGGIDAIVGIVRRGWTAAGQALATIKLSGRDEMRGKVQDIRDGIIRAISVGYSVSRWERILPEARTDGGKRILMIARQWMPHEISFVTVGFDMGAATRAAGLDGAPQALLGLDGDNGSARALDQITAAYLQRGALPPAEVLPRPAVSQALTRALTIAATPAASTAAHAANPEEETTMPDQARSVGGNAPAAAPAATAAPVAALAPAADTRAADIVALCVREGVATDAEAFIREGLTVEAAGLRILNRRAAEDGATGGALNVTRVQTTQDEHSTRMLGLAEALMHRVDGRSTLTDNGRRFRGMTLLEIGRDVLERGGVRTAGMDRLELATRAMQFRSGGMHTTSDFSSLLANVAGRRLRNAYQENPGSYTAWARRAPNAPDFKPQTIVQLAGAPDLLKVNEAGEFKYGTISDGAETYALATYGRIVSFSRQAMVNDDMRGFDRFIAGFGSSAARLENRLVYAQLTSGAVMADGKAPFHADHANLGAGALSLASLKAGRSAMRLQKGMQAEELNLAPSFLIVPTSLEQDAYQLTSSNYMPAKPSDVNEFRTGGRTALEAIVEPLLDASSATAFYLAANNSQVDTVEYCWLDGAEGPVIESEMGFEVDGINFKCREDFAAKLIDYRGVWKSTGV